MLFTVFNGSPPVSFIRSLRLSISQRGEQIRNIWSTPIQTFMELWDELYLICGFRKSSWEHVFKGHTTHTG